MTGKKHTRMIALVAFPSVCCGCFLPFFSSTHIYSSCFACEIHTLKEFPTQLVLLPLFLGRREAQEILSYETVEQGIQ